MGWATRKCGWWVGQVRPSCGGGVGRGLAAALLRLQLCLQVGGLVKQIKPKRVNTLGAGVLRAGGYRVEATTPCGCGALCVCVRVCCAGEQAREGTQCPGTLVLARVGLVVVARGCPAAPFQSNNQTNNLE